MEMEVYLDITVFPREDTSLDWTSTHFFFFFLGYVLQYGGLKVAKGKGKCEKIFAQKRRIVTKSERGEEGLGDGMKGGEEGGETYMYLRTKG